MFKNVEMGMSQAWVVTLFSMGIVFLTLIIISYTIDVMRVLLNRKTKKKDNISNVNISNSQNNTIQEKTAISIEEDETEIVAAISAAIAYILGKNTSDFIVKNIKRTPELDSSWANAGRMKLMR